MKREVNQNQSVGELLDVMGNSSSMVFYIEPQGTKIVVEIIDRYTHYK